MFRTIRHIATTIAALTIFYLSSAKADESWANIQPAWNIRYKHAAVRTEGGTRPTPDLELYGLADLDATRQKPTDIENAYLEGRVMYSLAFFADALKHTGAIAELNAGTGMDDKVRLGLVWTPRTWKGNFTRWRLFPYETSGEAGPQIGFFTSQSIGSRVTAAVLAEYSPDIDTLYLEPEVAVKLTPNISGFAQGRAFGEPIAKTLEEMALIVGLKYSF